MIDLTRRFEPPTPRIAWTSSTDDHRPEPIPTTDIALRISDTMLRAGSIRSLILDTVYHGNDSISTIPASEIDSSTDSVESLRPSSSDHCVLGAGYPITAVVRVEPHGSESNTTAGSRFESSLCASDTDLTITAAPTATHIYEDEDEIVVEEDGECIGE